MAGPVFRMRGVSKVYHVGDLEVVALRDVSLELFAGEFVVLLGPSGSGKSTLLNLLGGLDTPTAGEVDYLDHSLSEGGDERLTRFRREHVGFVFQFYNLIPSLTAAENVALVTDIADKPMDPREALALVGLAERADHFPAQLSGGEQQRVAIARAVAKKPDVLLCDEPTGALDVETGRLVLEVLERVNRELGTITAVITHNASIAAMGDRVIRMSSGRIIDDRGQRDAAARLGARVVRIGALDRKILRDAWHIRGQIVACALVVAGGINSFVSLSSVNRTLAASQSAFYEEYRFADVFAGAVRAPRAGRRRARGAIPGVAALETRVTARVNLDVPGLAEPARGPSSRSRAPPDGGLNALHLRLGRMPAPASQDEVLASEAFALANGLEAGRLDPRRDATASTRRFACAAWPSRRSSSTRWARDSSSRTTAATASCGWTARGSRRPTTWKARSTTSPRGEPWRLGAAVLGEMDRVLAPYGGVGAYDREDQLSHRFLSDEIAQNRTMSRITPDDLPRGRRVPPLHHPHPARPDAALAGGAPEGLRLFRAEIALHYLKLALVISLFGAALGVAHGPALRALHARALLGVLLLSDVRKRPAARRSPRRGSRSPSPRRPWGPFPPRCAGRASRRPSRCGRSRRRGSTPASSSAGD